MPPDTLLDGELVALRRRADGAVVQDFAGLGAITWRRTQHPPDANDPAVHMVAFDVPRLAGEDLCDRSWLQRDELLRSVLDDESRYVTMVDELPASEVALADLVALGFEGAVVKRATGRYRPGERSSAWRKLKARHAATAMLVAAWPDRESGVVEHAVVVTADGRRHTCSVWSPELRRRFTEDLVAACGLAVRVAYSRVDANGALREARVEAVIVGDKRVEDRVSAQRRGSVDLGRMHVKREGR